MLTALPSTIAGVPAAVADPAGAAIAGLSSDAVLNLASQYGPNSMPDDASHRATRAIEKLWAPVPWMLEAAIVLQLVLGKYAEAGVIGFLLLFNAALSFIQEGRAQATLSALKSRLALTAAVRRDGVWKNRPAADLVPGDIVKLSLGGIVPADVLLVEGNVLLDQSMLTGESIATEAGPKFQTYAGALIRRGEAIARVTATGTRTKFGRTDELVKTAHVVSTEQKAVLRIVSSLAIFNGILIVLLVGYTLLRGMPIREIIPLVLTAVLASIPVALPATFTLASALGARALARKGVLPTRLSAVNEAASIDVLCCDKTGTLTRNHLTVTAVHAMAGSDESRVLAMAALASSDGGQDPVDGAIRDAASKHIDLNPPRLILFTPFDPAQKMSEATALDPTLGEIRIIKGAFAAVRPLVVASTAEAAISAEADLESKGFRVLAVAAGPKTGLHLLGLIALSDPPRDDSASLITQLKQLGIRTVMVTGDAPATATIVARAVGLGAAVFPPGPIADGVQPDAFSVFAGVLPEDKYKLVKAFQKSGHSVGMCGDGVNDAPALRQAQIGIAVSTATDVAKSAAGVVLIDPGLKGIVASVSEGRDTFQRILNYTMRSVASKITQVLFLCVGLLITGHAVLTPLLIIIIMLAGDTLGMSATTDNVLPSPRPNRWHIGPLTLAGIFIGAAELGFCSAVLVVGVFKMRLGILELQTLAFFAVVCANQSATYAIRARGQLWSAPHPGHWLLLASVLDVTIAIVLAWRGWFMKPLPVLLLASMLVCAIGFTFILNLLKIPVFERLEKSKIDSSICSTM
jgi:H+-transporting ATPase